MYATRDTSLTNILVTKIGKAVNVDNTDYVCESNLVRIVAKEETT